MLNDCRISSEGGRKRTKPLQNLKQANPGASLRLGETDLLIAQGPIRPARPNQVIGHVRFRVEQAGYAQRPIHELNADRSVFAHWWTKVNPDGLELIRQALQTGKTNQLANDPDDPNGLYQTITCRDGGQLHRLWVEYSRGLVTPAFESAWNLLDELFPATLEA